jgi:hypothetical protein
MNSETHYLYLNDHPCTPHRQGHTEADLRAHELNVAIAAAELARNVKWRKEDEGGLLLERLTPIRSGGSWSWRFADSELNLEGKSGALADFDAAPTVCTPCFASRNCFYLVCSTPYCNPSYY